LTRKNRNFYILLLTFTLISFAGLAHAQDSHRSQWLADSLSQSGSEASATRGGSAPLPLGTVSSVTKMNFCPSGYYEGMTCYSATVSCPKTDDMNVVFGYRTPAAVLGTIFLHSGVGGVTPFDYGPSDEQTYVDSYFKAGYRVVELTWENDWETATADGTESILQAACRPATLLNYVYTAIHGGPNGRGAMCAQGHSAGSAALAYALAWYGAGSFLDKVVLTSGPVLSDIEAGCEVPNDPPVTVCPRGQFGCIGKSWSDVTQYREEAAAVQGWTGDPTCDNGRTTSRASNAAWKAMSIVDGTSNPSFTYPQTAMSAWLCGNAMNCSAAQGQIYLQNIKGPSQVAAYSVNKVNGCQGPEDIWDGLTINQLSAFTASVNDMLDPVVGCIKRH
jgi:hypothetical protein